MTGRKKLFREILFLFTVVSVNHFYIFTIRKQKRKLNRKQARSEKNRERKRREKKIDDNRPRRVNVYKVGGCVWQIMNNIIMRPVMCSQLLPYNTDTNKLVRHAESETAKRNQSI